MNLFRLLLISLSMVVLITIYKVPAFGSLGIFLCGVFLLPVIFSFIYKHRGTFILFVFFCSFGIMNTDIKLFDLLFIIVGSIYWVKQKEKFLAMQQVRSINYAFLLFIGITMLSIPNSTNISEGIGYFIHTVFMIAIYYFLSILIRTKKEFYSIILGYICTVLVTVLVVIVQKLGFIGDMGTWFQGVRAQGFFMDPNDFSPFLILAIFLLIERAFSYHYVSIHYFFCCFLAGTVFAVLLASMSRAALLNFTIVSLIYLYFSIFHKKKYGQSFILVGMILLTVSVTLIVAGDSIMHDLSIRFSGSTDVLQSYDADRFYYQRQGIILGSTHLFGIGPGQFELLFNYATHNLFVRIIAENGWLAFLMFVMVILYILSRLFHFRKKEVWNLPVYLFLAVFIGVIVNSFFLDTLHWRYLWFILGLCTILLNNASKVNIEKGKQ